MGDFSSDSSSDRTEISALAAELNKLIMRITTPFNTKIYDQMAEGSVQFTANQQPNDSFGA
jgi:hypothetical protein